LAREYIPAVESKGDSRIESLLEFAVNSQVLNYNIFFFNVHLSAYPFIATTAGGASLNCDKPN
jgi:hypothetical protein